MFRETLDFYFPIGRTMACSLRDTLWFFFGAYEGAKLCFEGIQVSCRVHDGLLASLRAAQGFFRRLRRDNLCFEGL